MVSTFCRISTVDREMVIALLLRNGDGIIDRVLFYVSMPPNHAWNLLPTAYFVMVVVNWVTCPASYTMRPCPSVWPRVLFMLLVALYRDRNLNSD